MQRILITYGTRPIALRAAKILSNNFEIVFATCEDIPSVLINKYAKIPHGVNPIYAHEIIKICLDRQIDYALPLGVNEIKTSHEAKTLIEEYGTTLLIPQIGELDHTSTISNINPNTDFQIINRGHSLISGEKLTDEDQSGLFCMIEGKWILHSI